MRELFKRVFCKHLWKREVVKKVTSIYPYSCTYGFSYKCEKCGKIKK